MRSRGVRLRRALALVRDAGRALGLPGFVVETASIHVRLSLEADDAGRVRLEELVAGAVMKSCEIHNVAVSLSDVAGVLGVDRWGVWRGVKLLGRNHTGVSRMDRVMIYVRRIVGSLDLPNDVVVMVERVLRSRFAGHRRAELAGKRPESVAAAAVYLVARLKGYDVSQRLVAEAAGVLISSLRRNLRVLLDGHAVVAKI